MNAAARALAENPSWARQSKEWFKVACWAFRYSEDVPTRADIARAGLLSLNQRVKKGVLKLHFWRGTIHTMIASLAVHNTHHQPMGREFGIRKDRRARTDAPHIPVSFARWCGAPKRANESTRFFS